MRLVRTEEILVVQLCQQLRKESVLGVRGVKHPAADLLQIWHLWVHLVHGSGSRHGGGRGRGW